MSGKLRHQKPAIYLTPEIVDIRALIVQAPMGCSSRPHSLPTACTGTAAYHAQPHAQ
ncbi:MAG: hypothetical protein RRB22_09970 [Gammaproteobacteria bacterium]|nr:hypothetical protein [Gammaproteobacteria bacterium]